MTFPPTASEKRINSFVVISGSSTAGSRYGCWTASSGDAGSGSKRSGSGRSALLDNVHRIGQVVRGVCRGVHGSHGDENADEGGIGQ